MIQKASAISTLLAAAAFAAAGLASNTALAADPELDARAKTTLEEFSKHEKYAKAVIKNAGGVLVFSGLVKAAFIFGAEGGNGALQVDGKSVAYYTFAAASFGFQAGVQDKSLIVIFRDKAAVDKFQAKDSFEVGVDANVAFFKHGAGSTLTSTMEKNPVVFYVFDNTGLLADFSMQGGKFVKLVR
jgi:lipid-binding SYLF domain-containing protein